MSDTNNIMSKEWFVLRGENKYGPFAYGELIKMLQARTVFEHDYIWSAEMEGWKRVADVPAFKPDQIKSLHQQIGVDLEEIFFRRRHARASYGASLIVHNNKKVWKGNSMEISAGGAGIVLENVSLMPGDELYLHFKPGDGVPPFNAVCSIVSKSMLNDGKARYGVKFTKISSTTQKTINQYATKAA